MLQPSYFTARGSVLNGVHFGVFLPFYAFKSNVPPREMFTRLKNTVLECEQLGYDSVWIDDHLMYGKTPVLECWSTLAALFASTSRIRLGTMVTSINFRNPAVLAKAAATVDVISGGRLEFGIGAGVQKEEHLAYGLPFPSPRERAERLDEAVQIVKAIWTQESATFKGKYYQVSGAVCEPKPLQKPHPPVTIGGCGEKYTLKVTAQHADRFDFGCLPSLEEYNRKLQVLESHCKAFGRPFGEIEKSCWPAGQIILAENKRAVEKKMRLLKPAGFSLAGVKKFTFAGTPEAFAETLKPYWDLGVKHFMLFFADLPDYGSLRAFASCLKN